ncbi:MAG: dihydroorotase [Armatimonadota bacterium]
MPAILIRDVEYYHDVTDVLIDGQSVTPVSGLSPSADQQVIDGHGLKIIPALNDFHVHFRDPGLTEKEDLLTGARAAAAGGYTTVSCEPNTRPVIDTVDAVDAFYQHVCALNLPITVKTKAALTLGQRGEELSNLQAIIDDNRAAAFSDDGEPLVDHDLLVQAIRKIDWEMYLCAHCEETPRSAARVEAALGAGASMMREPELIRMHLQALENAGDGLLYIQHISLAESARMIAEAKRRGLHVTAEVTPHHLLLCEDDIPRHNGELDANWKMNPPLRSRDDMLAMRKALAEGVIDTIATDHAPHTPAEKAQGWDAAPFGIIGLETALGACLSLVHDGTLSIEQLYRAMCGKVSIGGSVTLIDLNAAWTVDPEQFYSKSRNCPFAGMMFKGKPVYTIANGQMVMAEGKVLF